jgi:hypothetical protein
MVGQKYWKQNYWISQPAGAKFTPILLVRHQMPGLLKGMEGMNPRQDRTTDAIPSTHPASCQSFIIGG